VRLARLEVAFQPFGDPLVDPSFRIVDEALFRRIANAPFV